MNFDTVSPSPPPSRFDKVPTKIKYLKKSLSYQLRTSRIIRFIGAVLSRLSLKFNPSDLIILEILQHYY